jgi:hypothetical protein
MSTTNEEVAEPNWAHAEEVEPGLQRLDAQHEPLKLSKDTHIVSVFGEDIGRIEGVYGYAPTNEPVWASVKEGDRHLMVPVMSGQMEDDGLHVPYPKKHHRDRSAAGRRHSGRDGPVQPLQRAPHAAGHRWLHAGQRAHDAPG